MKVLLVMLIVGAIATPEIYEQFKQIDSDEFGKTLIDTLQMTMSSGEPILKFTEIMRNLETSIEQEQKADDKANNEYQSQCTDDVKQIQQDAANLERRTVEIQSLLDELVPLRDYKQGQVDAKTIWQQQLQARVDELVAKRAEQKADFDKKQDENDYAQFIIETVRRMFAERGSTSFLQTSSEKLIKDVKEYFVNAATQAEKFTIKKSYSRMFTVLAEIAASGQSEDLNNSPTVKKILSLCDQLLKNIENSRAAEIKAEKQRISMFTLEKQLVDKDLTRINQQLAQLEADILQLNNRIQDQNRDLGDYNTRLGLKQKQIEDRSNECREKAYNYQLVREKREQKRQLVSQIIGIFTGNQRDFQDYVKLRSAAGDFQGKNFKVLGNPEEQ